MKHSIVHRIHCLASKDTVYEIIRDSSRWPELFEPCKSVIVLENSNLHECIEMQAMINNNLMTWISHRKFLDDIYGVDVTIIKPIPLLKMMKAKWRVISLNAQESIILLTHDYEIVDNVTGIVSGVTTVEQAADFMKTAIENNSIKELASISYVAQEMETKLSWSKVHSIICECNAKNAYHVLKDITLWPQIFEACQTVEITNRTDNIEEILITAKGQGRLLSWTTQRTYYDDLYTIDFVLTKPMPLLKLMKGTWRVISLDDESCVIYVERHFELLDDVSNILDRVKNHTDAYRFVTGFIEENADIEMNSFKLFMLDSKHLLKIV